MITHRARAPINNICNQGPRDKMTAHQRKGPDNLESRQNGQDKVKEPSGSTYNHPRCQHAGARGVNMQEPRVSTCNHPRSAARVCLIFQLRIDVGGHFRGIVLTRGWNGFRKKVEWFLRNGGMVLAGRSNRNGQFFGQNHFWVEWRPGPHGPMKVNRTLWGLGPQGPMKAKRTLGALGPHGSMNINRPLGPMGP